MQTKPKIILVITVMMLSMLACSLFGPGNGQIYGNHSNSSSRSKSTFTDKSEMIVIELEVKSDMLSNVLSINNIKLDEGEIRLRLLNPEDEILKIELLEAPTKFSEQFELEAIPGVWKLEMDMDDASGSYDINWEAKN